MCCLLVSKPKCHEMKVLSYFPAHWCDEARHVALFLQYNQKKCIRGIKHRRLFWCFTLGCVLLFSHNSMLLKCSTQVHRVLTGICSCSARLWYPSKVIRTVHSVVLCWVWSLLFLSCFCPPDIWCPLLLTLCSAGTSSPASTPSMTGSTSSSTRCLCSPCSSPSFLSCTESGSSGLTSTEILSTFQMNPSSLQSFFDNAQQAVLRN